MVDYVDDVESEIAVGKPIKAATGLKMVRNFLAIITGGANAPKIKNAAFADNSISGAKLIPGSVPLDMLGGFNPGDVHLTSFDRVPSESVITSTSYVEILTKGIPVGGGFRIKFGFYAVGGIASAPPYIPTSETAYAQIYREREGVITAVGIEHTTSTSEDISEDIDGWFPQDRIILKAKISDSSNDSGALVFDSDILADRISFTF